MIKKIFYICLMCMFMSTYAHGADDFKRCDDNEENCRLPVKMGKSVASSRTIKQCKIPSNTEKLSVGDGDISGNCRTDAPETIEPFTISVDGIPLHAESPGHAADTQRCIDVAAAAADIRIRYDSLEQTPWLNVHATPDAATKNRTVKFAGYSNYTAWIRRAEVRIFTQDMSVQQEPFVILPATAAGITEWTVPNISDEKLIYVLRVYDCNELFDETRPKILTLTWLPEEEAERPDDLAGYGEDSRYIDNIPVKGGAVTVDGKGIKEGQNVLVMGAPVPVDTNGSFAARQILPDGPHTITVAVSNEEGTVSEFTRNISIAADDWFYIGFADLTMGQNDTAGPIKLVTTDPMDEYDDNVYVSGKLAFYLKGKIKGKYLLTAAADTREQPIGYLFSNFNSKDPRYLLRRLDPDRYYPVYGDDSTAIEDAPTQGKFYVKVERGDSHVMWGNFKTTITDTEFARYSRGLYGANLKLESGTATEYGEKRIVIDAFAADPGSLPAREELRGTGGSLYYMQRQDITQGSETVWIEIRDKDTGLVIESRSLAAVQDYNINYLQGRITLREALTSTVKSSTLVSTASLSGHPAYLVATYEYTPGLDPSEDMTLGGRAHYWINDHLRLGATGYRQKAPGMGQKIQEGDLLLRYKPGTYIKYEGARSDGAGSGETSSMDGGYNFNSLTSSGEHADAHHIEVGVDFSEVSENKEGRAKLFWKKKESGFSGFGEITGTETIDQQGIDVDWQATKDTMLKVKADESKDVYRRTRAGELNASTRVSDSWTLGAGIRADKIDLHTSTASDTMNQSGDRTDLTLRADYESITANTDDKDDKEWSAYTFLQGTLERSGSRDRNNRAGIGGERRVNDRFVLNGEVSDGNSGLGALAGGEYRMNDRTNIYTNYAMSTDRSDTGYRGRHGLLTAGAKTRYSDSLSVFNEERLQHGDGPSGLTHAFGLDLAPNDRWAYSLKYETGKLSDPVSGDMERDAIGLSISYNKDNTKYGGNLEFRNEDGNSGGRETWLMRNNLGYQVDPDWRYLGRLNTSVSIANTNYFDGRYVEFVNGFAYRPVDNDRFNGLFKYTYFYDLPSPGQLVTGGALNDYTQQSHVLSADGMYDVKPWWSLGGKYGIRSGKLRANRVGGQWFRSKAQLFIVRSDLHWVHEWDVIAEARMLQADEAGDTRYGALLAVHRHINKYVKVGIGYNFADFSDDLTDVSYRSGGWFLNIIGKM